MATSDDSNSLNVLSPIEGETNQASDTSSADAARPLKPTKTAGLWFLTILNLLIIIALIGLAVWYYFERFEAEYQDTTAAVAQVSEQRQQLSGLTNQQQQLQQRLSALQQNETVALDAKAAAERALSLTETQLSQVKTQLDLLRSSMNDLEGRRPADWLLAEADYLVRLAGHKIWLEDDVRSAIMLLKSADSRLADLNEPSLIPLRTLLAEDIQRLRQVNPIATTSIALALSGLLPQVNQLPLISLKIPDAVADEDYQAVSGSVSDWKQNLKRVWRSLMDDFVSVRQREKPLEPLMSEQAQWLVKEQLRYALMQAKSAALDKQTTLYQQSLQRAIGIVVEHFKLSANEVEQFMAALKNLQQTDIERSLPEKLATQQPLADLLNQRINRLFSNHGNSL